VVPVQARVGVAGGLAAELLAVQLLREHGGVQVVWVQREEEARERGLGGGGVEGGEEGRQRGVRRGIRGRATARHEL
jgi:hypothetical protein